MGNRSYREAISETLFLAGSARMDSQQPEMLSLG